MYVGERYSVTSVVANRALFICVHCKAERTAMAVGVGTGTGTNPYFIDGGGARARANEGASAAAGANLSANLACARCPSCGKHDGAARAKLYAVSAAVGLGAGALVALLCVAADQGGDTGYRAGIALGLVTALVMTIARARRVLQPVMFEAA